MPKLPVLKLQEVVARLVALGASRLNERLQRTYPAGR